MTARELFAVIVRAIGLALLVIGVLGLGFRLINHFLLPAYALSTGEGAAAVGFAFVAAFGLLMLMATRLIVRMVYGP